MLNNWLNKIDTTEIIKKLRDSLEKKNLKTMNEMNIKRFQIIERINLSDTLQNPMTANNLINSLTKQWFTDVKISNISWWENFNVVWKKWENNISVRFEPEYISEDWMWYKCVEVYIKEDNRQNLYPWKVDCDKLKVIIEDFDFHILKINSNVENANKGYAKSIEDILDKE
jgi:hypothetical protein